jgi:hypothetical protein
MSRRVCDAKSSVGRSPRPPATRRTRGLRLSLSALSLAVLAGCASFSGNGGMDEVAA